MIYLTEDALDDLSQMDQEFLNPTALNFREISPQVQNNYDEAFNRNKIEDIAYRLGRQYSSPIRRIDPSRYENLEQMQPFERKIKNAAFTRKLEHDAANRDPEDPFSNPEFNQQLYSLADRARGVYNQNAPQLDNSVAMNSSMNESASIDKNTLNLMYNYGKSELQKDIAAFGKHYLL